MNNININDFIVSVQDTATGGLIMFPSKIKSVLNEIAKSKLIYAIIEKSMENFNYSTLKSVYFKEFPSEENFTLPQDLLTRIALSYSVLYELFKEKISLTDFLNCNFKGSSILDKYNDFCDKLLYVFGEDIISVIEQMQSLDNNEKTTQIEEPKRVNLDLYKNQVFCLKLTDREKKLCINFLNVIKNNPETELEKISFYGLEGILSKHKKGKRIIEELRGVLNIKDEF